DTVTVRNVAPTITSVTNNGPINEGGSATITVTATDPAGAADPLSYEFDCNNDNVFEIGPQAGNSASCPFNDNGSRQVNVRVNDGDGGTALGATTVTVNNVNPTATLSNNGPVDEGSPATISFSGPTDPSTADTGAGFHYASSCTNGSLAGATYAGSGASASTSCAFADNGTSTVRARIIDKDGGFTEYTTDVVVQNVAPTANLSNNGPVSEG